MNRTTYRVAIVQETIPHYRIPFFADLRHALADQGVTLALLYGRPTDANEAEELRLALPWARPIDLHVVNARGVSAVYQPVVRLTNGADLVVVEQANRMLANYALFARQAAGGPRVALWGHGANLQSGDGSLAKIAQQWKRTYSTRPHWWFAYTEGSADRVQALGFDRDRITVVQNAVDTAWAGKVGDVVREPHRAVYVGRLYKEKRLEYLVAAGEHVAGRIPDFRLVILGDGPERAHLDELARDRSWLEIRGTVVGHAKAVELARASVHLMPGLVGLAVVDSFATGTPLVTTDVPFHSPEVEYLVHGVNGVVLPAATTAAEYGTTVAELLEDERALRKLRAGCRKAAKTYTLDAMVSRFASGVVEALHSSDETPPKIQVARDRAVERSRSMARAVGERARGGATRALSRVRRRDDLELVGTAQGGWSIPSSLLDKYSVCYAVTVGADLSFPQRLVERFGCEVWLFDRSTRARTEAAQVRDQRFHFTNVALGAGGGGARAAGGVKDETVAGAMRRLGHEHLDLLAVENNGHEAELIEHMLDDGVRPTLLCVSFGEVGESWQPLATLRRLERDGYRLHAVEGARYVLGRSG